MQFNLDMLDRRIDPCTDFYAYACNKWQAQNPIPSDQSSWGQFDEVQARTDAAMRSILEAYSASRPGRTTLEQKTGEYYQSCMDEDAVERAGIRPLESDLAAIDGIKSVDESLPALVARLHRQGINVLFTFTTVRDFKNSARQIAQIEAGGTAIPDPDFYLRNDRTAVRFRAKYMKHMQNMFALLDDAGKNDSVEAKASLTVETKLAEAAESRSPDGEAVTTYQKMGPSELASLSPVFPWGRYFDVLGTRDLQTVQVSKPQFFQRLSSLLQSTPLEDLKSYLRWQVVHARAQLLPSGFVQENFNFFDKELSGTRELPPRWQRCVHLAVNDLGGAVGESYAERYFNPAEGASPREMVEALQRALADDLAGVPWMGPETRIEAIAKLKAMRARIGAPAEAPEYTDLSINPGQLLENSRRAAEFKFKRQIKTLAGPPNQDDWPFPASKVDASYSDQENVITLPAGILQPPFYEMKGDRAFNFGAIGGLIGHELTHGFDDQGSRFDAAGNLRDWWSLPSRKGFRDRAQCFVEQYSDYTAVDKIKVDGEQTLAENIADNGGLRLAYAAMMSSGAEAHGANKPATAEVPTREQRFFLGWANLWCQNRTSALSRDLAANASHAPGKWRVNGVVSNMPEFRQAFHCRPGAPMVRPNACRIW